MDTAVIADAILAWLLDPSHDLLLLTGMATMITAFTPTPDPNTVIGKMYKVIEVLAGIIGKAKQTGLPPAQ